ncbi:phosphocholine cytidylyltransferase family protein [Gluconacetobacter tumulisoli]|uniref:NTP transferase domain-containing protein n=1 Tax=Gluconacetobacter tumulisoli TaxID=1286189 RepID=A0A7W4K534_9PROT|nr:NTP transferase domain-containing protein [Gluconacetobacter tumulisoli]MBB2200566.1 NTP transferase domain-containing protein [Gluconacetobacter tumulisoli]
MKCLIVAAGQGSRLRDKGPLKPLVPIRGRPLIAHVIERARRGGIDEFVVVNGYRGDELQRELDILAAAEGVGITHVRNPAWDRANGVSVLCAKPYLDGPFLLTMCDHLLDPQINHLMVSAPHRPDTVTLGVDFDIDRMLNDPDDVTRVKCTDGRIERIGKSIEDYNAFDTGIFLCTPIMFDALESSQAEGEDSISGAMNTLARWRRAHVLDIGDRLWIDVDDPVAYDKADRLMAQGRL